MSANETQVGGTHYKTPFQHWDLVHELDLGYFEGQITKYLTRHRFKKGREDAEKALHFTKKMHELALFSARKPHHKFSTITRMTQYAESNKLLPLEYACIMSACNWSMTEDLKMLEARIERLIRECYPEVPVGGVQAALFDTGEPGRGYADQGKDI
jgi:hypothetical protein